MNVGQSTRAIPGILNSKNVIWIFFSEPMKCPLKFFMLYFAKIEVEKMDLLWVKSEGIYFLNMRSKVIAPKLNIIFFYFTLTNYRLNE